MRRAFLSCLGIGLVMVGFGIASEPDDLREKAKAIQKKAAILAEEGKPDAADSLYVEAKKLMVAAEQLEAKTKGVAVKEEPKGADQRLRQLKEALGHLRLMEQKMSEGKAQESELAGVREKIAAIEREFKAAPQARMDRPGTSPDFRVFAEKLEAATRRIQNLRVAAENLKQAEVHDLAQQIMQKAEAMEREVQEARKRLAEDHRKTHGEDHGADVVRELRSEVERLRAEIKELRQRVDKR